MLVYSITNAATKRMYIGSTRQSFVDRVCKHKYKAKIGVDRPLYRDMRELGFDAFLFKPLAICASIQEMLDLEKELIERLRCSIKHGGYNIARDGLGSNKGGSASEVARLAISNSRKAWWKNQSIRSHKRRPYVHLTEDNKELIVSARRAGKSYLEIAKIVGCSPSGVCLAMERWGLR